MKNTVRITTRQELLTIYKPLLIVMVICGFNYGVTKNVVVRSCLKLYSLCLITITSYASMTCCESQEISFIWSLLEYAVFIIIMMFFNSKMSLYFKKVILLDTYMRVNRKHYYATRNKQIVVILLIWLLRVGHTIVYCVSYKCYNVFSLFLVYEFSLLALDINRVWRFCIFEEIWRRLKLLRKRLEDVPQCPSVYLYVKDNKAMKENKVKFCFTLYRQIADLLDLISPELNASLFISVVCSLPKLILNVYRILLVVDEQLPYAALGNMVMHITQISLFIFTPCVVVELYQAEVGKIRMYLMHQLIEETDPSTKEDLRLFLQYTKLRPFRYKIWRVIPLDLTLPLNIVNLCTTYVIVIVNFTQVFS